jgi:NADH dehydrogenase
MKSLFLTGASGFLGSSMLRQLRPGDYDSITLLSRSAPALPERLAASGKLTVVRAAIHEVEKYSGYLTPETRVVHLAAVTGKAAPQEYFSVNADGTRVLAEAAAAAGSAGFLFVSSIAVAFSDRRGYHYADSKEQAEHSVRDSGLRYCIVRPTIILGEGSPIWGSFSALARASVILLPGSGRIRIQPIHVDDLASLLLEIVSSDRFSNETLDLGGPETLTMDQFVRRIHTAMRGGRPRMFHLPLGPVLGILRLLERPFPSLLPVSSGQFASFCNDGTATGNDLLEAHADRMMNIDDMLQLLTREQDHA